MKNFDLTWYQKNADIVRNCFWGPKCLSYFIIKMPNETEYHDENGPQGRASSWIWYYLTRWKSRNLSTLKLVLNVGLKCSLMPMNAYIYYLNVYCDICFNGSHFEYHFWKKICSSHLPKFLTYRKWPIRQRAHPWGPFSLSSLNCWITFIIIKQSNHRNWKFL